MLIGCLDIYLTPVLAISEFLFWGYFVKGDTGSSKLKSIKYIETSIFNSNFFSVYFCFQILYFFAKTKGQSLQLIKINEFVLYIF